MLRWLLIWLAPVICAQTFDVAPLTVRQGEVLRIRSSGDSGTARMNGRTIRLFSQKEGGLLGLMPVPVAETPGASSVEFLDKNGAVIHSTSVAVRDARFPRQNIVISDAISALKPSPGESEAVAAFRNTVSQVRYWAEPLAAPVFGCLTSPFGVRRFHNGKPTGDYHGGFDQRVAAGRPIRAVTDGVVKIVRQFNLRGGTVAIDHGQGLESMYQHMSKFGTTEGAMVKKGDVIGYAGSTGRSTGPHLHWSIYVNGVPVNPGQWVQLHACTAAGKSR